jgi:hypothetical protein
MEEYGAFDTDLRAKGVDPDEVEALEPRGRTSVTRTFISIQREGGTEMQVGGTVQGASTIHPRRRLNVVLAIAAIVVIAAVVALVMWVVPLATSGGVTEDAIPKAGTGSAVVHHVGNMTSAGHPTATSRHPRSHLPHITTSRQPGAGGADELR